MNLMLNTFKMWSLSYFIYFIVAIAVAVSLVLFLRKVTEKAQKITKISLVCAIIFFVILEYIGKLIGVEKIKIGDQLPFEIFDIFAGISVYLFFSKKSIWKKFSYLITAPVSLYSIIFVPNIYTQMGSFSLAIISFYLLNSLLIVNSILYMLWDAEDLEKKDILSATMNFVIIVCIMHLINVFFRFTAIGIHANYLGTMGENFDILIDWLYSLISVPLLCLLPLVAILVGVEFLCILPFDLIKTKKEKQSQIEELIALGNLKEQQAFRKKYKSEKSQILVRSQNKATPKSQKNVTNNSKEGFVSTNKEIQVNNQTINEDK